MKKECEHKFIVGNTYHDNYITGGIYSTTIIMVCEKCAQEKIIKHVYE